MDLKHLFEKNKNWVQDKQVSNPDYFSVLGQGQSPELLYIGCSDSRVVPEQMMGLGPGDVFVHRNIANLVSESDASASSVVAYAVSHLKVSRIVICGHYGCGGVQAALGSADLGVLNPWIQRIKEVYHLHRTELDNISDEGEKHRRLVALNVEEQCLNLLKIPVVQKACQEGSLSVHGWIFDTHTGNLIDLSLNFD